DVGQVLAALEQRPPRLFPAALRQQAGVGDATEDALAILVARPRLAQGPGAREAGQVPARLVGGLWGGGGPRGPPACRRRTQGHVAVKRLLDKQEMLEERLQPCRPVDHFPEGAELVERAELFVSIEAEGEIGWGVGGDDGGDAAEAVEVRAEVAAELDLE